MQTHDDQAQKYGVHRARKNPALKTQSTTSEIGEFPVSIYSTSPGPATTPNIEFPAKGRTFRICRRCGKFRVIEQRDGFYGWVCDGCLNSTEDESRRTVKDSLRNRLARFLNGDEGVQR